MSSSSLRNQLKNQQDKNQQLTPDQQLTGKRAPFSKLTSSAPTEPRLLKQPVSLGATQQLANKVELVSYPSQTGELVPLKSILRKPARQRPTPRQSKSNRRPTLAPTPHSRAVSILKKSKPQTSSVKQRPIKPLPMKALPIKSPPVKAQPVKTLPVKTASKYNIPWPPRRKPDSSPQTVRSSQSNSSTKAPRKFIQRLDQQQADEAAFSALEQFLTPAQRKALRKQEQPKAKQPTLVAPPKVKANSLQSKSFKLKQQPSSKKLQKLSSKPPKQLPNITHNKRKRFERQIIKVTHRQQQPHKNFPPPYIPYPGHHHEPIFPEEYLRDGGDRNSQASVASDFSIRGSILKIQSSMLIRSMTK